VAAGARRQDRRGPAIWDRLLAPLESLGVLQPIDGDHAVMPGIATRHLPGHTPGHQVVQVSDGGSSLLLSGDAINHPAQLQQPELAGGPDDDQRDLLKGNLGERVETNLGELLEQAEALLREHRSQVLVLAHALETHKTIAGEDVIAVLDGTPGPLIDGSAYHEPAFLAELEAYHGAVEAAHDRHEKVSMPLPKTNGQTPEPEPVDVGSNGPLGPVRSNGPLAPVRGPSFT